MTVDSFDDQTPPWQMFGAEADVGASAISQVPFVGDAVSVPETPAAPPVVDANGGLPAITKSRTPRFSPDVDRVLDDVSQTYGVDRGLLGTFAAIESGGNPTTRTGSYKGLFQLSNSEFARHGGVGDIYDPGENAKAAAVKLKAESADFARRYGRDPSAAELYMIHQQGIGGADRHWRNPDAPAWQNMYATAEGQQKGPNWAKLAIWGNVPTDMRRKFGDVNNITSRDFVGMWNTKVERFGGGTTSASFPQGASPERRSAVGDPNATMVASGGERPPWEMFGGTPVDQTTPAAPAAPASDAKPWEMFGGAPVSGNVQPEGFFSGLWKAFSTGAKQTGSSIKAAAGTYTGNADSVVESARYSQDVKKNDPAALTKFNAQVEAKKAEYGDTIWGGIKNVASAAVDNPKGVLEFVVQQAPNSVAAMTPALAAAGVGSFFGPVGTAAGFLVGLFGGNTVLETGGKAQERAQDGSFTDAERADTIKEGAVKGGVITAVDVVMFGTSKWWFGATSRAVEKATAKALADRGIDVAAATSAVKMAQAEALAASKGLPKDQVLKNVTEATVDAMRRTGLSDDAIVMAVKEAQDNAIKLSNSVAKRAKRFGGAVALETVGEGVGEYLGELAATGQAKPTEAVMEAIAGLTMSVSEAGAARKMGAEAPGPLTRGFGTLPGSSVAQADQTGTNASAAAPVPVTADVAQSAQPVTAAPANPAVGSVISPEDLAILRKAKMPEEDIADLGPEERAEEVAAARDRGVTVTPEEIAAASPVQAAQPDQPSAEPVSDITAQIDAMSRGERGGVYLSSANLSNVQGNPDFVNRIADALNKAAGAEIIENADGKGGILVTANKPVADLVRVALTQGVDTQALLGLITGAGTGKPAGATAVVQQKTPDGAVTSESLVRPEQAPAVAAGMEKPDATVETVTPQQAIDRRDQMIAAEQSEASVPLPAGDGTRRSPVKVEIPEDVAVAASQVAEPTEAQKDAGNYKKGHLNIQGLDITIENAKGSTRSGTSPDGSRWEVSMPAAYGYIKGTVGRDGDQVDVFLGPDPGASTVYVIDQVDADAGQFDEHKAMVGFPSRREALNTYRAAFSDGRGNERMGGVAELDVDTFRDWLGKGKRSRPITDLNMLAQRQGAAQAQNMPTQPDVDADAATDQIDVQSTRVPRQKYDGPPLSADEVETSVQPQAEAVENLEPPFDAPVVKDDLTTPTVKQDETVALDEAPETGPSDSGPAEQPLSAEDIETLVKAWRYVKAIDDQVQAGKNIPDAKIEKANELDADLYDYGISLDDFQTEASVREYLGGSGEQVAERPASTEEEKPAKGEVTASGQTSFVPEPTTKERIDTREDVIRSIKARNNTSRDRIGDLNAAIRDAIHDSDEKPADTYNGPRNEWAQASPTEPNFWLKYDADGEAVGATMFDATRQKKDIDTGWVALDADGKVLGYARTNGAAQDIVDGKKPSEPAKKPGSTKAEPKETVDERADTKADNNPLAPIVVVLRGAGFKTIVEARKFVKEAGIVPADATNKQIDETIETAVVAAARQIVAEDKRPSETFAALTALYANQPNLASRTGTSVANQAYSTPAPLAYVASRLAGVSAADSVYEPSAGNGMLLIEADTEATTANEIDPARAQALKAQGFAVTEKDGAEVPSLKNIESVIMNPPFGAVKNGGASKVFKIGDLATTKIDHAISLNALEAMADDGKAVLIIGGVKAEDPKERAKGYRGLNMRDAASGRGRDNFYRVLYDKYNVVDHFTVSGDLYTKQGASWPVDVIVIDGRGQSQRPLPGTNQGVPDLLKTWGQVGEKITDDAANDRARNRPARPTVEPNGRPASVDAVRSEQDGGTRAEQPTPEEGGQPAASGQGTVRGESSSSGNNAERPRDVRPEADRDGGRVDRNRAPRKRERVKVSEGATQATYQPISETQSVDTLVPANMADAVRNALERVDMEQGGVDQRVSSALGYETDDDGMFFLSKDPTTGEVEKKRPFSAEQIDAIALAISNIEKGDALIVGDATGIGKGRIGAAILRYAMKRGLVPVLVTEKMDLYGDMYRDMRDIGMFEMLGREPHILTTDTSKTIPLDEEAVEWKADAEAAQEAGEPAPKRRGKFLSGGTPAAKEKAYDGLLRGDDVADVIFTTYSQMQTLGENAAEPRRRKVLRSIASRSVMIFDEAHNAAGTGIVDDARGKKAADGGRAQFVRNLAQGANGVVFMSATYAKRPNVMDLYARTDMGKAVSDIKDLPALIQKGGVPMQQIVASMLAESGQYLRRERSFDGIEYAVEEAPVDEAAYDKFVGAVQAIFQFDLSVKESRKDIIEEILDSLGAGRAGMDSGIGEASATSTSFSSIMHNIVSQMLLAIKANAAAERAIAAVKAGEKPVITLANTNESFISDFAASDGTAIGQPLDIDFGAMLKRYLQRTLRITYKEAGAKKPSHYQIPLERLPIHMQNAYRDVERLIDDGDYDGMPVSPIDWIRYRMADAGISVREITGRKTMLDYSKKTPTLVARPKGEAGSAGKRVTISKFNGGSLDAVILNQSGSTGVSMHTNRTFKDQRKRRMILAQAEANIDTHMQMLGRVNRTGQVVLPAYSQLAANIPAEVRPTAVLMKKMASLNANTTGARGSAFTADAVDFMNEVGDKIMAEYLSENYDVNEALGEPYSGENTENLVRDATGKLVLLSVAEQRRMLDEIQAKYKAALDELDALGENPLEAKKLDLQARTIESSELKPRQGDSPFLDAVRIEKVSVKAQGRAMPPSEVVGKISDFIKIEKPSSDVAPALGAMADRGSAWMRDEVQRVGTLIREQIREEVASVKAESKESTRRRLLDQFQRWQTTMALMHPGARVAVNMPSGQVSGIVTSVERTGKAKNMGALGSWTVKIAVADSLRELTFPMSKLFPPGTARGDTEAGAEVSRSNLGPVDMVAAFEDARKEGRETRFMVTGNILGGFDETRGNGQIVTYTTDAGEVKPGILMKRGFEMGKFMEKRRIRFQTGAQVATFLDRVSDVEVAGRDGDVLLGRDRYGYYIRMSSARAKAGRYFTDRTVRDAIAPQDFERRSGQMRVEELAWDQFVSAVDAMKAIGAGFETDTAQDEAQAIVSGEALSSVAGASGTHDPAIIRRIERNLKAGRATNIDRGAVKLALDAIEPDLDLMPPGGLAGTVSRIEPGSAPGHVRVSVTLSNGKVVTAMIAWDTIKASRSLFLPGRRPAIVSLHFTPVHGSGRDGVGQQAGSRLVGEVSEEAISIADALRADFRHELVHALRFVGALDGRRWGRLVSHASSLGLLGLDITLPASQRIMARELWVEPNRTLRESYTERYARHDNMQELLDQESVASLMELVWLGSLSDADVAPVRDILDDLAKGDLRGSGRQVDAGGPLSSLQQADVATGQSMRRDIDTLGYYSKALESARGLKQAKGTPEQMLAQLKASGVKDAEIDATKLRDVFDSKKSVTRDEIVAHLEMNRVALAEVRRGKIEGPELDRLFGRVDEYLAQLDPRMTQAQRADMVDRLRWNNATDRSPDAALNSIIAMMPANVRADMEALQHETIDTKWSTYSLDPSNPTYRETVIHLPDNSGLSSAQVMGNALAELGNLQALLAGQRPTNSRVEDTAFRSGHFPEPNIIGHMMTSMTRHEGKLVYTIDQIQSDWGQKIRDGEVRDEERIEAIRSALEAASAAVERQKEKILSNPADSSDPLKAAEVSERRRLVHERDRLEAELFTAQRAAPGHPLVNTTDQWVNTTLRRAVRQAVEAGAEYIAIPHGDTVLSYNPGDTNGMRGFYGSRTSEGIVPKNLRKLIGTAGVRVEKIETTNGMEGWQGEAGRGKNKPQNGADPDQTGFTLFPLTEEVKRSVMEDGQPMFSVVQSDGASTSYRRLGTPADGLTPAARSKKADLARDMTEAVNLITRMTGKDAVRVSFASHLSADGMRADQAAALVGIPREIAGKYSPKTLSAKALIELSLGVRGRDLVSTAAHEAYHHVETVLASLAEMKLLRSPSEMARARKLAMSIPGVSKDLIDKMPDWEVRAIAYQRVAFLQGEGVEAGPLHIGVRRFWNKLVAVTRNVRNALRGQGFDSMESIFERARTGAMVVSYGQRQVAEAASARRAPSRGGLIRQMETSGFVAREPFDLKNAREVRRYNADVPLHDIRTTQAAVGVSATSAKVAKGTSDDGRLPSVFKWGSLYYVNDGNHRVEAARARGEGSIRAEVIELAPKNGAPLVADRGSGDVSAEPVGSKETVAGATSEVMASIFPSASSPGTAAGRRVAATMRRLEPNVDKWRVRLQDKVLPIRRQQESIAARTGQPIPQEVDVYKAEANYHGRAGERAMDLQQKHIEPLLEIMRRHGIDRKSLDEYLTAKHAGERNTYIRSIDPSNDAGSGMTDEKAAQVIARVAGGQKAKAFDDAAAMIYAINKNTRDTLLSAGLITRQTYDAWETEYEYYVPLRGFEAIDSNQDTVFPRIGRGFDVRGPEAMAAFGRRSEADSPFAYSLLQAHQAIVRAEKNRVNKVLWNLVNTHPDPDVWKVFRGEYRRRLNETTGLVESYFVPPPFSAHDPSVVGVKIGGKQHYIQINMQNHANLARALRGVGQSDFDHAIVRAMMKVTRTYAQLLTSYNPEFVVSNFFRDVPTALLNSKDVAGMSAGARKQMFIEAASLKSIRSIYSALRGDPSKYPKDITVPGLPSKMSLPEMFEEFRLAGGKISFMEFNDVERIKRSIQSRIDEKNWHRALRGAAQFVEDVNTSVENGVRLSAYVAMRKAGISKESAAFSARELTVNFNRKGEWGPIINSAYLFFNASVQGSVRMVQAVAKSKAVRRAVYAIVAGGIALDVMNYIIAGDDDDGENAYEKIKPWIKERNLIFMLPGRKDYLMIPLPYGYNLPFIAGQKIGEAGRTAAGHGKLTPAKAAAGLMSSMLDVFNPLGTSPAFLSEGKGSFLQMVSPTILDPVVQVAENRAWYGGPIFPTKFDRNKPDSENYYASVHPAFIAAAKWLNSASGGNAARSGAIDISPEVIEHYAEFLAGGVGKFVLNATGTARRLKDGEEFAPEKAPFLRRLYGAQTSTSRRRDFYEEWTKVDAAHYEVIQLAKSGNSDGARSAREKYKAEIEAYGAMKGTQKTLSRMSKERTRIQLDRSLPDDEKKTRIKEIQDRENKLILRALGVYVRAQKKHDKH